jgi:hypothetical protein
MSRFAKLISIILGAVATLYVFTCSSFLPFYHSNKVINHDEIVAYVLEEVTYEMDYGNKNINIDIFVDQAIQEAFSKN